MSLLSVPSLAPWTAGAALWLVFLLLGGCGEAGPAPSESLAAVADDTALEHAAKHLDPTYVCPMHPQIVRDEPGSCPICGMKLVARRTGPVTSKYPQVHLSGTVVQSMGVRTAPVERGSLWKSVRTVGRVDYDETRIAHVHPRAEGWIEVLALRAEGEPVTKGQQLAQLYAPEILSAQVDFLIALQPAHRGAKGERIDRARNLLRLLDVSDSIIRDIERTGQTRNTVPVVAPIGGVITQIMAREGMYVSKASEMFTIVDLSQVWVMVDVFERQIAWVRPGLTAEISVPAYPGKKWQGVVDYLYPDLDAKTRSLRVRLVFPNPDLALKPNMFADVMIHGGAKQDVLKVPREALIVTGERESVVKALGDGRFQPVDVVTGMRQGNEVEILSGLTEEDAIVISGQFLIDSESGLRASFMRMSQGGNAPAKQVSGADVHPAH